MMTENYLQALTYAARLHADQVRKDTEIPYLTHLMAVSGLVFEGGGSEDEAIAGLLHDALEDQADKTSYDEIAERFGPEVARIVVACSDRVPGEEKLAWRPRKEAYIAHLKTTDEAVLRVSLADKLHNARSIVLDGPTVFSRFNKKSDQPWYYSKLAEVFIDRLPTSRQAQELAIMAERMTAMAHPLPADPPGHSRDLYSLQDHGDPAPYALICLHRTPAGTHVDAFVPGSGWVEAPWHADVFYNGEMGRHPVTLEEAQRVAAALPERPLSDFRDLARGELRLCRTS